MHVILRDIAAPSSNGNASFEPVHELGDPRLLGRKYYVFLFTFKM